MSATASLPSDKELWTVREIARRLSVSERTVWRLAAQGVLPAPVRLGSRCSRWRAADVRDAVNRLAGVPR
jgi:excisionase family DNA binding protein